MPICAEVCNKIYLYTLHNEFLNTPQIIAIATEEIYSPGYK